MVERATMLVILIAYNNSAPMIIVMTGNYDCWLCLGQQW